MTDDPRERQSKLSQNRGSNQIAVRSYNERLVLQLIRSRGNLTKTEATAATGLSANAVSTIFRALGNAGLVLEDEPLRGRVGQPSTPVRLNPDAHHYFGLKVGRKSLELALINFVGDVLGTAVQRHDYPTPPASLDFVRSEVPKLLRAARLRQKQVVGFGVAMPSEIWSWRDELHAPDGALEVWRDVDVAGELEDRWPWPATVVNDGTAACAAELVFKQTDERQDYIYLFVGTMIGGGVVLNGSVFFGRKGNAGGFGPLRVPSQGGPGNRLIDHASLYVFERMLVEAGVVLPKGLTTDDAWTSNPAVVESWLDMAARGIAHAIASSLSVIDFEAVIIDGSFPEAIRSRLVDKVRRTFCDMDLQGLTIPEISEGHWGSIARAVGAAALFINKGHSIDQNTLLRVTSGAPTRKV